MNLNRLLILSCFCLGGALFAAPAHAQLGINGGGSQPNRLLNAPTAAPGQAAPQLPPPAIPGVQTQRAPVAAAERPASDMSPNDALFDAINRGDTTAARDALNRGADLNATNILGMTPLALSVDLNRDDITFILLSMRGAEPHRAPAQQTAAAPPAKPGRAVRVATQPAPLRPTPTATAQVSASTNTGTPNPSAGFLGFGPR